ncbi:MAG: sulfatase-like hydrolase/transferase, partial [Bacteroidales bacterium]|nr:sulfatase-like hydrolase/transferase [Bacteroidales bacterium]
KLSAGDQPNIILILLDDVSPDMFSCYAPYTPKGLEHSGYTPNIDKLASEGVMFKTCYAAAMCAPSRVELVTGRYANATGVYQNGMWINERSAYFLEDFPSLGRLLKDAGYATAIAGKWHEGAIRPYEEQGGFDEYCIWSGTSLMEQCDNYKGWNGGMENETTTSRYWNPGLIKNGQVIYTKPDDFGPEICNSFLMDFMERSVVDHKPFFAYWPCVAPHGTRQGVTTNPLRGEVGEMGKSSPEESAARFKSLNEYIDLLIGRMMAKLTELGIHDNTLFIVTSDNGTAVTAKTRGVERGCHVVNVMSGYHVMKRGATDELTDFTDIAPTLMEISGAKLPKDYSFDGESLVPFLSGQRDSHRDWIYGYISTSQVIRTKEYLVEVLNPMLGVPEGRFCYTGPNRFREGYVRVENIPGHQESRKKLMEIASQFTPVTEAHPFWKTNKGRRFFDDYTSVATRNKHLHNHREW